MIRHMRRSRRQVALQRSDKSLRQVALKSDVAAKSSSTSVSLGDAGWSMRTQNASVITARGGITGGSERGPEAARAAGFFEPHDAPPLDESVDTLGNGHATKPPISSSKARGHRGTRRLRGHRPHAGCSTVYEAGVGARFLISCRA